MTFAQLKTSAMFVAGTTGFENKSFTAMKGFSNFQDDLFHSGLLVMDFGVKQRYSARTSINLNLSDLFFIFIQADVFTNVAHQKNAAFLENSAGLSVRVFKGLSIAAGYQMDDYSPRV